MGIIRRGAARHHSDDDRGLFRLVGAVTGDAGRLRNVVARACRPSGRLARQVCQSRHHLSDQERIEPHMRKRHAGGLVGGVSLLLIGGWLGAVMLGAPLLGPDRLWPVIPMASGLALLACTSSLSTRQLPSVRDCPGASAS